MQDNSIISRQEHQSNVIVAKTLRITSIALTVIFILNLVGIFIVDPIPMLIAYIVGMIALLIPTYLVNYRKIEAPWLKWVFVSVAILFVTILIITLNQHAVLMYIFAIAIAGMYFSRKLNLFAAVGSVIMSNIAQTIAYNTNYTIDHNMMDVKHLVVFYLVPRTICLIALSAIFLSLNSRMTNLLNSLLDVDAQREMLESVNAMRQKSLEVSSELIDTVQTLAEVTDSSTKSNTFVSEISVRASEGAGQTFTQLGEVSTNIDSISDNLAKLASSTDEISSLSTDVRDMTAENAEHMTSALKGFEKISESTAKSSTIISELESKSQEIRKIVEVITNISGQTNLLALNASIESARAGEAGKGFAVVAEQIRQLAEQTKDAVGNISSIIDTVVENTDQAVASMAESAELVSSNEDIIRSAEASSNSVTSASDEMHAKIDEIDTLTRDVAAYAGKIVQIVHEVRDISSSSLDELKKVTETSAAGLEDMATLNDLVHKIENMSAELKTVVDQK